MLQKISLLLSKILSLLYKSNFIIIKCRLLYKLEKYVFDIRKDEQINYIVIYELISLSKGDFKVACAQPISDSSHKN